MSQPGPAADLPAARRAPLWQRALPWVVTVICFGYLYSRLDAAAAREGLALGTYLGRVFARVPWGIWLALMVPYSALFFLIDSLVIWRVIHWFNAKVRLTDILPIRASAYILSIINEQIGKAAIGVYLYRRERIPGWEIGSSMLFVMFCEFYYLLGWATLGYLLERERLPAAFAAIPWVALAAITFFVLWISFFAGRIAPRSALRERPVLSTFRKARPWHYGVIVLMRSPALLAAVVAYTIAGRLFGLPLDYLEMLGLLPVIFFGAATPGPMRSVAIVLWVALFPAHVAAATAFGFVMHNFFILFNAAIGLLFLPRANRELLRAGA
jgi:hypothetical protein